MIPQNIWNLVPPLYGRYLCSDNPVSLHAQLSTLHIRHCLGVTLTSDGDWLPDTSGL